VEMPWADKPASILQAHLLGEAGGQAIADLVTGKVSPSGKLAETYPISFSDYPCTEDLQMDENLNVKYKESIFVGYRYFDTADVKVRYPFGYGLSYTKFEYSDLVLSTRSFDADGGKMAVKCTVTNVGDVDGAEVVELYVAAPTDSLVYRPKKELKDFAKVFLKAGETKTVEFELDAHAFEYYSAELDHWAVEAGSYAIMIGASSADIRLQETLFVASSDDLSYEVDYRDATPNYYKADIRNVDYDEFLDVLGYNLDDYLPDPAEKRIGPKDCLKSAKNSKHGQKINGLLSKAVDALPLDDATVSMIYDYAAYEPLDRLCGVSHGLITQEIVDGAVHYLNDGSLTEAVKIMATGVPAAVKNVVLPKIKQKIDEKDILE